MNTRYINQVNHAINYIMDHLEEELDVNAIAEHCHLSKYYFNRLFKSVVGESVYSFVKRVRLERSAFLLKVAPNKSITQIGAKFNYSSSNFSWAFKQHYNLSPAQFRKRISKRAIIDRCSLYNEDIVYKDFSYYGDRMQYIELPNLKVIYERFIGNYMETSKNWSLFLEKTKELIDENTMFFDISHDDPVIADENRCIFDICITTDKDITGYNSMVIDGGKYVSYDFEGPHTKIFEAYQGILGIWLPNSDVTLDDRKIISLYKSVSQKFNHIKMDICIPIK